MAVALVVNAIHLAVQFLHRISNGMGIGRDGRSCLAAQQLIQRHICQFALDVPQSHINTGHCIVDDRAIAPVGVDHHQVPQILDVVGIAADENRLEVILHHALDRQRTLLERSAAHTVNALVGQHLDGDQIVPFRICDEAFDICNDRRFHKNTSLSIPKSVRVFCLQDYSTIPCPANQFLLFIWAKSQNKTVQF